MHQTKDLDWILLYVAGCLLCLVGLSWKRSTYFQKSAKSQSTRSDSPSRQDVKKYDTKFPAAPVLGDKTDYANWRLQDVDSRHTWLYLDKETAEASKQDSPEKHFLGLSLDLAHLPKASTASETATNGFKYFKSLQMPSGHWACQSDGPMLFAGGVVITWFVTKTPIPNHIATELKNYLVAKINPDGGWGLHSTGPSTVCVTATNYCVLRILGMDSKNPIMSKARSFILNHGGAVSSSIWGKFWLAVLGVLSWDTVNPIPPEIWLLPDWAPIAPWRFFCEARGPFQSMSYLYSKQWSCEENDLVRSLREEVLPSGNVDWKSHRNSVAVGDYKQQRTRLLNGITWFYVNVWKPYMLPDWIKEKAESRVSELIDMQDANTDFLDIAVTDAPVNTIICYFRDGPNSASFNKHIARLQEYLWMTPDGMAVNSTNGSQCWDTAFAVQAAYHCGLHNQEKWKDMLLKSFHFFERHQIRENCPRQDECYRQHRKGGWGFSNKDQGYAVSDCIAESLKAVISLQNTDGFPQLFTDQRIFDAIDCLLIYQNSTGGVTSFERRRGGEYLEMLNHTEVFGRLMVEYDYPECSSSSITALTQFRSHWPEYRTKDVNRFIDRAIAWIKKDQRPDGSWYGSWGICFTYGTMFALDALASVGEFYGNSDVSKEGCEFLLSKQRADGGWSESYKASETMEYEEDPMGSLVVQTAWSLIGLLEAKYPDPEPMERAARLLMERQQSNGEWLEEAIPGAFHNFCTFSYPNYKFHFTLKALGLFSKRFPSYKF